MALERVPADIRKQGGVARMSDPKVDFFYLFQILIKIIIINIKKISYKYKSIR